MADTQEERARRDEQIRETIMTKLVESGEKDRLKVRELFKRIRNEKIAVMLLCRTHTQNARTFCLPLSWTHW